MESGPTFAIWSFQKRRILKWLYAHPRDFSTTIFRATTPKLGECFLTIGISVDVAPELYSRRSKYVCCGQKWAFGIKLYAMDKESLEEFENTAYIEEL